MKMQPLEPEVFNILKINKISFRWYPPNSREENIIMGKVNTIFPSKWNRIQPEKAALKYQRIKCSSDNELIKVFVGFLNSFPPSTASYIMWSDGAKGTTRIATGDILRYSEDVYYEDSDMWVFGKDFSWCIELYHDLEVTIFT